MIDHKSSIGKFLKNWNYFKYTFWPHAIRLGIISGKKTIKNTNTWRLNHMLLKNENATKEPKEEKKKIPGSKWEWKRDNSKPIRCSKSWLREKFIVIQAYLKKQKNHQVNNLTTLVKQLEKE